MFLNRYCLQSKTDIQTSQPHVKDVRNTVSTGPPYETRPDEMAAIAYSSPLRDWRYKSMADE